MGETFTTALDLYGTSALRSWQITALVIIPIEVLQVIVRRAALPSGVFVHNGTLYTHSANGTVGAGGAVAVLAVYILNLLGILLATGAVFRLQLDTYLGHPHSVSESFAYARARIVSLLSVGLIVTVLVIVGLILFIIPGIYALVALSVAVPALMQEGLRGRAAVRRSMELVRGRWWATFARLLAMVILYIVLAGLLSSIGSSLAGGTTAVTTYLVITAAVTAIGFILFSPLWAATVNVLYVDLRVRSEGAIAFAA